MYKKIFARRRASVPPSYASPPHPTPPPPRGRDPQSIFHSDRADCREDPLSSLAAIHSPFSVYSSHLTTPAMDGKCRLGPKIRPQSLTVRLDPVPRQFVCGRSAKSNMAQLLIVLFLVGVIGVSLAGGVCFVKILQS